MRRTLALSGMLALSCSAVDGPLWSPVRDSGGVLAPGDAGGRDGPDGGTGDAGEGLPPVGPVRPGMRLQYQLVGDLDESLDVDLLVVDLFETPAAQVARLADAGQVVVAYLSAGTREPWRPDVDQLATMAIGQPLSAYPEEAWLDVRDSSVRGLMEARLALAADKGFQGVLLSSLHAYQNESGHDLTAGDQLDYDRFLAEHAHGLGLAAGLSSDWQQAPALATTFDFAIHFDCIEADRCDDLAPYRNAGRAIFNLETSGEASAVCAAAAQLGVPTTLKRPDLGAWAQVCNP